MRVRRQRVRPEAVVWFGAVGPPVAWTVQHLTGYALTEASCGVAYEPGAVNLETWTIVVSSIAAAITLAAGAAALTAFRATRGTGTKDPAPPGRYRFLSIIGLVVCPLFLAMIVMSAVGAVVLVECRPG